jgi:hypothetical protein
MHCPHCGCEVEAKKRSAPDHRRLFAIINNAFAQWPEGHDFQPDNSEHLRAWLIAKAGWREATPIALPENATDAMQVLFRLSIEAAIKAAGGTAFVVPYRRGVAVVRPKSMAFSEMSQQEFSKLRDAITDILEATLGCKVEELTKEAA